MKTPRVLFVDDDPLHPLSFVEGLRDDGFSVVLVDEIREALAKLDERPFDLVVLDMLMPRGSMSESETAGSLRTGFALARRIRREHSQMPIAFLTIARDAEAERWCSANSPAAYFIKGDIAWDQFTKEAWALLDKGMNRSLRELDLLLGKIPSVVRELGQRYGNREPFTVADEYDVQDLLRALLRIHFEDIRAEEWTPSYAGGAARIDLYLAEEGIAIEIKKTRRSLSVKQLGEELIIDVAKYKQVADCNALVCYVYDKGRIVTNPNGFRRDLEQLDSPDFRVMVRLASLQEP